ncbi:MAG: ribosomal protein L11 methyltransferase [Azoarcus sp.]|uniref:Ribosomal protein L11 methyltransferase n=1 Tax=Aromatoleum tolulyticum TaxID=34027 RepID=A0A1N6UVL5_9RHOO|nr:50S ribosomal protein L11 methyltransferase [Aromatoleum tolulyticum]MCK9987186.1 ribosomal protein L11 methyltransferase [Azoarcus sp.]SIQ69658.1 [LSU ribosomal protein L11P]-lysine N-methyltransferase [Aromatoleum tolulyticum]
MWISVTLQAEAKKAEALSEALMEAGALSISIEDADAGTEAEKPQFGEPGHHPVGLWDHSRVTALFDAGADLTVALARAAADAGFDAVPPFTLEDVAEQNWVQLTQSQFDPIRITERMWIVPSWHTAPDPTAINIELDPGMAFGTGSHPTTRLCLEWLCDAVTPGAGVLDYGCGSGILGIAAAKLGAADVLGVDIDDKALEAAHDNAQRNGVTMRLQHSRQALDVQFDIVVANILTNPLCVLAPLLAARVAPGGRIALSGVLDTQTDQVIAAYAPFIALRVGATHEGWARLEGTRPATGAGND